MSINIVGISPAGVSNLSVQNQLLQQLNSGQTQMSQLEMEISTGHQFQLPSENPLAVLQVEGIQSLLQRKDQALANISANQSLLSQADSTLGSVSSLLASIQSAALGVVGSTASPDQRQAVIQQVDQAIQQLVGLGNTQLNGQSLFSGAGGSATPFSLDAAGHVVYSGSSTPTQSYVDVNQLMATSVTGDQAFGAMSQPVQGAALPAALSPATPLADLGYSLVSGGQGIAPGSIAVSDGQSTSIVDLSGAKTLGDVATLIEQHPPAGRIIDVDVTPTGLTLRLESNPANPNGNNLSVQEVNGGSTAGDLGIASPGTGTAPLVGQPLTAAVAPTTPLGDLLGTKAQANIHFGVANSDIVVQANAAGAGLNGVTVHFVADAPGAGQELAAYAGGLLTVHISTSAASASRADQVVAAINSVAGLPFTASLDPSNQNGGGQPPITALPPDAITAGGGGTALDTAGLQITSGGKTCTVDVSGDNTVQDLLNSINSSGAGLDAEINAAKTGIDVRSRTSGVDFAIGENGGQTATQLGVRTLTAATQLSQLNYGAGVGVNTVTAGGTDFTISETLGGGTTVAVPVSIAGAATVGDVIQAINTAAQTAGATFNAQLATTGNGIELTDANPLAGPIVVTAGTQSTAAVDLGLVAQGQTSATSAATAAVASGWETSGANSELLFSAVNPGNAGNVQVIFQADPSVTEGNETAQYDASAGTLTFRISSQTTANDIIAALQKDPMAGAAFTASLDTSTDPANDGSGVVQPQQITMSGGEEALTGSDANPQETDSVFTALERLGTALNGNDSAAVQRAMGLLSNSMQNVNNTREQVGVQEQSLSTLTTQINNEELGLQSTMSTDYDTDMASAISDYTTAQISYQATLETTASLLKMTLLNYL